MMTNKTRTVLVVAVIAVLAGSIVLVKQQRARVAEKREQEAKISVTIERVKDSNVGQIQPVIDAKSLIMTAMTQKKIPAATNWCDTLNVGGKLWPVTPTNAGFALNSKMAGFAYVRGLNGLSGDTVVFFETARPGWNQAGGPELLANKPEGVIVAFLNGRTMTIPRGEISKLQWGR